MICPTCNQDIQLGIDTLGDPIVIESTGMRYVPEVGPDGEIVLAMWPTFEAHECSETQRGKELLREAKKVAG